MAGIEHTSERQVPGLADQATDVGIVGTDLRVAGAHEILLAAVRDIEGDVLATEPIADPVGIAVHQVDLDALVKQGGQVGEIGAVETAADEVARLAEGGGDAGVGLRVVCDDAEGGLDVGLAEVAEVVVGREGGEVAGADVVDGAAGGLEGGAGVAVGVGLGADVVDGAVVAGEVRVAETGRFAAGEHVVEAGVEVGHGGAVCGCVDGLDAVGVVVGHLDFAECLGDGVDAAVDDAEGVEVDGEGVTSGGEGSVGDEGVLLCEVGRESWAVVAAVLGDISQGRFRL